MTTWREAAQQVLEAFRMCVPMDGRHAEVDAAFRNLRAALAQQAEPVQMPGKFDHGIGADRFKVVRGAYWWHVLIGDSQAKRWKFHTQAGAEEMAALLLREFRNGAFVRHEAALAQQAEPVAVAERERIAAQWDGCFTHQLDTFGPVDIGASIRAGELVGPAQRAEPVEPVASVANNPDPYHLSRILHELAGSASMCWEHVDRAGVFQSTQAAEVVAAAIAEIRQRMKDAPPQQAEPAEPAAYAVGRTLHWHEGKGVNDAQLYLAAPPRHP